MKPMKLFVLENCPHCHRALQYIQELQEEHPEFKEIVMEVIEERREKALANSYDYYYVPCFYVNENKVHEGAITKYQVNEILQSVMPDKETVSE